MYDVCPSEMNVCLGNAEFADWQKRRCQASHPS